jgi:hypothetical protein
MISRFCRYLDKCFHFQHLLPLFTDSRKQPHIPRAAVFASVFALFACNRTSLHSLEKDLVRLPQRLRGLVGPRPPHGSVLGRRRLHQRRGGQAAVARGAYTGNGPPPRAGGGAVA